MQGSIAAPRGADAPAASVNPFRLYGRWRMTVAGLGAALASAAKTSNQDEPGIPVQHNMLHGARIAGRKSGPLSGLRPVMDLAPRRNPSRE
jgi:hypothetical protein